MAVKKVSYDPYFNNILHHVKEHVPEFNTNFESDNQYMVMFEFGEFLVNTTNDEGLFARCINFINEAIEKGTSITHECIALEVFQPLYHNEILPKVKSKLSKDANIVLAFYEFHYNRDYHS